MPLMLNAHRPSLDGHRRFRNFACRPTRTLESREQRMSANLVSTYRKKIDGTGCDISHSIDIDQCSASRAVLKAGITASLLFGGNADGSLVPSLTRPVSSHRDRRKCRPPTSIVNLRKNACGGPRRRNRINNVKRDCLNWVVEHQGRRRPSITLPASFSKVCGLRPGSRDLEFRAQSTPSEGA
jgi:hypothetical protein